MLGWSWVWNLGVGGEGPGGKIQTPCLQMDGKYSNWNTWRHLEVSTRSERVGRGASAEGEGPGAGKQGSKLKHLC